MVRNERDPRGTSISEQYGRPVTASDVEDLMHQLRVPSGTIFKVMQAVRQALTWTRYSAVRPWAGELEEGLTRQEAERRERRHEQQRLALENAPAAISPVAGLNARRAAAVAPEPLSVNTPEQDAARVWADNVLGMRRRDAPGRSQEAPVMAEAPSPLPVAPPAVSEPGTALSGPQGMQDPAEEVLTAVLEAVAGADAQAAQEILGTPGREPEFTGLLGVLQGSAASPPQDAPAEPAAPPAALATGVPRVTAPPAASEAPAALSGPPAAKACAKCGKMTPLEFFQRDARSPDGRRARCKICTSDSDEFRRKMVQLRKTLLAAAQDVQDALESPQEAPEAPDQPDVPPEAERASQEAPRAVQEVPAAVVPDAVPAAEAPDPESLDEVFTDFRQQLEHEFAEEIATGRIVVLPPAAEPEENDEDAGQRQCKRCGKLKGVFGFYQRQDQRVRNVCIECERKATRDRRAAKRSSSD